MSGQVTPAIHTVPTVGINAPSIAAPHMNRTKIIHKVDVSSVIVLLHRINEPSELGRVAARAVLDRGAYADCFKIIPNSPFLLKRLKSGRIGSASQIIDG